jgi:DNA-binding PadR family transcriptional regulator
VNLKLLMDGVVRQTTVLLAQLSTTAGARSPLAHVADQVFVELAREIESQGVRRQVVADMFGMALRSYQKKMRRLTESASVSEQTLWQAVLNLVEREQPTRSRVLERFQFDGEREVAAVLKDLVRSGLVSVTGSGDEAVYTVTSDGVRDKVQRRQDIDSIANLAWLLIFRREVGARAELAARLAVDETLASAALDELVRSGRVSELEGRLVSSNVVLPLGAEQGWETAILDHFRTVSVAIATKIRTGFGGAKADDRIGGSTFTFTVTPGHPYEREVNELLKRTRLQAQALWDKVAVHNQEHPPDPEQSTRVSFYLGQVVDMNDDDGLEKTP